MSVAFFVFTITLLIFVFNKEEKAIPHRNPVDLKISLYSDQNITPNAVATNPEFKNITFATSPAKNSFFQDQIASAVRAVKSLNFLPSKKETAEYGSWIWTPIMDMAPEYMDSVLWEAKDNGINIIYLSLDSYLDIYMMPKGREREKQKEIFSAKLEDFITKANRIGIEVDAEAGWRNWAEEGNTYKAFAIVNYVKNFNATHPNTFRGFQYDIEPYLLDNYEKEKENILKNFVALVDKTEYFIGDSALRFSIAIPDFYDRKDGLTPKFSYNGRKDYTLNHLLSILDRRKDSSIILMSYRNFADGSDGSIEISKNEMQTAKRGNFQTKIIIAQETGEVLPPYITFHDTSKDFIFKEIMKINEAFEHYPNFGGIAIHYTNAFLALK